MCHYYIIWFGKYRVVKILADNRNRTIYLTEHNKLNCYRVIKRVRKTPVMQESFKNEVRSLKNLKHPNIPIIYDIEEDREYYYIIEEYIEGESLRAYRLSHGFIEESKILDFTIQLCNVIETLHSNKESILYLDLKPDNIIICNGILKLIDFGTAILEKEADLRCRSFGTKGYAAPEQYSLQNIDKRCDIYGIGSVLFFLMTGCPFINDKESFKKIRQTSLYSVRIKQVLYRCLRFIPSQRYSSVTVLKLQLQNLEKKQKNILPITPIRIVIAEAERRMGATHFGIMLTVYLNTYIGKALYIETEEQRVVWTIKKQYGEQRNFSAVSGEPGELIEKYSEYSFYICDYGVWTTEKEQSWQYDVLFLLVGIQPWEQEVSQRLISHFKNKAFYFAPKGIQSRNIIMPEGIRHEDLFLIPYQIYPFELKREQIKFMEECINNIPCFVGQKKKNQVRKKLHWWE